uniref:Variant surface glycoprotein n=2 Tax=Trypanosoma brucei TaxID=5691 RepID=A0A1V0FYW7_9TRYP|nr:variant surface glycoprotein [Trypanosoma brucei]
MMYFSSPGRWLFKISVKVALLLITSREFANIAKDDNVRERGALCGLIELGNKRATLALQPLTQNTDLADILELNMTVSDEAWRNLFQHKTNKQNTREFPDDELGSHKDWKERWNKWQAAAETIFKSNGRQTVLSKHKLQDLTTDQEAAIRPAVRRLAVAATAIATAAEAQAPKSNLLTDNDLQTKLNKAIYGDGAGVEPPADGTKLFTGAAGNGPQANCEGSNTTNKATTVAAALLCVCTKQSGAGNSEGNVCDYVTGTAQQWPAGSTFPGQTVITDATKLCDLKTEHKLSAEALAARVTAITNLIARRTGAATFGKTINGGCTGSQDGGMCIKYTDLGNDGSKKYTDIPWLGQVADLETALRKHEATVQVHQQAASAIKTMRLQTQSLIYSEPPQPREQIQPKTSTPEKNKRQRMRATQRQ